jgi:hypothetical protein
MLSCCRRSRPLDVHRRVSPVQRRMQRFSLPLYGDHLNLERMKVDVVESASVRRDEPSLEKEHARHEWGEQPQRPVTGLAGRHQSDPVSVVLVETASAWRRLVRPRPDHRRKTTEPSSRGDRSFRRHAPTTHLPWSEARWGAVVRQRQRSGDRRQRATRSRGSQNQTPREASQRSKRTRGDFGPEIGLRPANGSAVLTEMGCVIVRVRATWQGASARPGPSPALHL